MNDNVFYTQIVYTEKLSSFLVVSSYKHHDLRFGVKAMFYTPIKELVSYKLKYFYQTRNHFGVMFWC